MKRHTCAPRPDWRARVEAQGLLFHRSDVEGDYWGEGVFYELAAAEAETLEQATTELQARCLDVVAHVIAERRYGELAIPALAIPMIEASWAAQEPSLYGRMDLAFGPDGVPKLLEYNADTPTSLLEAAVIQWTWLAETEPAADQWNRLHEALIATWRELAPALGARVWFACVPDVEDEMTIAYLRDTAEQAGISTASLDMDQLGWNDEASALVDLAARPITALFKLYPWEGLVLDALAPVLPRARTRWLEPAWKMILSNKAILPILAERFPGHPNVLACARTPAGIAGGVVKKPLLGREGSNVTIAAPGVAVATEGPYGGEGFVYQAYADLGEHAGMRPVIGAWVIGGRAAGIGIRETPGYVTNNTARFCPHLIR